MCDRPDRLDEIINGDIPPSGLELDWDKELFDYDAALFCHHEYKFDFCESSCCGGKRRHFSEFPDGSYRCVVCGGDL